MRSLRTRLLAWLLPTTLAAVVLAGVCTYWGVAFELADILDDQLRYVAEHVHADGNRLAVDRSNSYQERLTDEEIDRVVVEAWDRDHLAYTSDPELRLAEPRQGGFADQVVRGVVWHTFVLRRGDTVVRVAQVKDGRWEALARITVHLLWPIAAMVPLLGLGLWFGIGRGLRPLQRIADELGVRDTTSMTPVTSAGMPDEVMPMVDALNGMLVRLDHAFEKQKAFVADAAHELRTPIMAVSVQAGLAASSPDVAERDAALRLVCEGSQRLAHLAQQLLTLARLEPGAAAAPPEDVDLLDLCKSVVLSCIHEAEDRHVDLGVSSRESIVVSGRVADLRILLRNLVDNAVRYTPRGGRVDVLVGRDGNEAVLEVRDDGPGIPVEDRERVFDRFYRGPGQAQAGSGLGLSIVRHIALAHGVGVSIGTGLFDRGATFSLRFPVPGPASSH